MRIWAVFLAAVFLLTGCSSDSETKVADLDYTVVADQEIPQELAAVIEEKRSGDFRLTYSTSEALYLVCGYGAQETGGYSIQVKELYLTENTIVLDTELIGPDTTGEGESEGSEPVIVIKTALREEPVVFR
ncbi:MAG: protease complex subunit PrcB family protein [Lachnospiraceae bacterium]|nr:protease complex subunit PrcB family protein [Lachnospiraceae bacterium]